MMAQQRRPSHRVSSAIENPLIARRKLQSRRGPASRRRVYTIATSFHQPPSGSHASVASSGSSPSSPRPVLVPLHVNLRRLPSRLLVEQHDQDMHDAVQAGNKRKRVVHGTENALANGRGSRAGHRVKRRRAMQGSSEEEGTSSMEIDNTSRWDLSGSDDDEDGVGSCESYSQSRLSIAQLIGARVVADNYLLNAAEPRQLLRLRKDELVRLYAAAGLTDDAELLTKNEIVDHIMAARDDLASLPPSSPPGAGDSGSSDYSSDGGNVAGGEETDFGTRFRQGLNRRATLHEIGRPKRRPIMADRCFSLPQAEHHARFVPTKLPPKPIQTVPRRFVPYNKCCPRLLMTVFRRRSTSTRSSPTSATSTRPPSPPATRLRTRKLSNGSAASQAPTSGASRGKVKQVGFNGKVEIQSISHTAEPESDITDLETLEEQIRHTSPSPRRLRSQGSRDRINSRNGKEKAADKDEVTMK